MTRRVARRGRAVGTLDVHDPKMMFDLLIARGAANVEGLVCVAVVVAIVLLATSVRRCSRRCSKCQEINREVAVFCAQCGTRLPGR